MEQLAHNAKKQDRIFWCDNSDGKANFDSFASRWGIEVAGYDLEFIDLDTLMDQDSDRGTSARQSLCKESSSLLLIDWEEGTTSEMWAEFLELNPLLNMALMSFTPRPQIEADPKGLIAYEGLESSRILTRPFEPAAVLALLPSRSGADASITSSPVSLSATYGAWRWLTEDFTYVQAEPRISAGWKLSYDRPGIQAFTLDEIQKLKGSNGTQGESLIDVSVRQYMWHELPFQPGRFDRIMLETRLLREGDPAPTGAKYVQQAVYAPIKKSNDFERNMIQGILELMRGAEFSRGRYYYHNQVPGLSQPVLELLVAEPEDEKKRPPPAVAEIDQTELGLLEYFVQKYPFNISGKRSLIYKKMSVHAETSGKNDTDIWDLYVDTSMVDEVIVVPVYFTKNEALERKSAGHSGTTALIRGVFIFDLGRAGEIQDRWIDIATPALIAALTKYTEHRDKARAHYERTRLQKMDELHRRLGDAESLKQVADQACFTAIELMALGEKQAESGEAEAAADRSALYVRYSATQQLLEQVATYSSDQQSRHPLHNGDLYPLEQSRFFLVQAARDTLERLKTPLASDDLPPLLRPNICGLPVEALLTPIDWKNIFGCNEARIDQAQAWYISKVKAVLAFPVVAQGALQGVLVVRSDREYEFTQRRVDAIAKVVRAIRAHLVRVGLLQRGRAWHGLLAHELRTILGRLGLSLKPSLPDQARETSQHAHALLSLATTLAQGSLHVIHGDQRPIADGQAMNENELLVKVNDFGRYLCAQKALADDVNAQWNCNWSIVSGTVSLNSTDLLLRVLLMLIDNAFRHSVFTPDSTQVLLEVVKNYGHSIFELRSPGQWPDAVLAYWQTSIQSLHWLDEVQDQQRPYLGLSLVHWLCAQAGAAVTLKNDHLCSVVCISWPYQG